MSNKENTELTVQSSGFNALANADFSQMVSDELEGLDIGFERIKIPSGGSTMFELPSESDEPETVREFSGVILFHHTINSYYRSKYTGGSNPPDCGSYDGVTGEGDPGGSCKACPFNQFGSGENGAKACRNKRHIYILREGEVFPLLLSLPAGSLKPFTKYLKTQLSKGRKTNSIVTRFSLKKVTNNTGIAFSQAQFAVDRALTPEEYALIESLSNQIKTYASSVFEADDGVYVDTETGEVIEPPSGGKRDV